MQGEAPPESTTNPPSIWAALDQWAKTLAPWQQFIIGAATSRGKLTDAEVNEAYRQFLVAKKLLADDTDQSRVTDGASGRPTEVLAEQLILTCVDDLEGINALPNGAKLTFASGLTAIYGRNGAGKSGFARLLANACFSRQKPQILTDIYADGEPVEPAARFHVSIGGVAQPPITFSQEVAASALKRITVFDAAVARHHITQSAAFEFKPIGFDVFPEIVRVYGFLADRLDADIAKRTRANEFPQSFLGGGTNIHTAVSSLGATTDLMPLRRLGEYGDAERSRIDQLDKQILALQAQSPAEVLKALREASTDIGTLRDHLDRVSKDFTADAVKHRAGLAEAAKQAVVVAATLGSDQFRRPFFKSVGSPEWESFVATAHGLARRESPNYASTDDRCLLCERPLDQASRAHINDLLAFVEGDARRTATTTQEAVATEATRLAALELGFFSPASRVHSHVARLNPEAATAISDVAASLVSARDGAVSALKTHAGGGTGLDFGPSIRLLASQIERIDADIARLEGDDTDAAITSLNNERRTLRHRNVLSQLLPAIEIYVADAAWAAKATQARTSLGTRPITEKEKEMFGKIVGDTYKLRLLAEFEQLDCNVPVEMQTVGRSGQTIRSLAMKGGHKPETILSEGEQKAVALADFLTEVGFNPASAGIVFDDPVNSQDHQRKLRIAHRLVAESATRQVIVFTHDLVFLNQLFVAAEEADTDIEGHWVDRSADGRPGQVALGDSPVTSRAYENTKRASAALADAQRFTGAARDDALRKGMGALRTTLEETVVRKIFKDAVPRWSDQVRVTTLRRVNWDNTRVDEVCDLYEDLSRRIEGHTHTDEATGAPADPKELEDLIRRVDGLIKWAKSDRQ